MATDINIQSLFPVLRSAKKVNPSTDLFNATFIGIDFGTSTTVVSMATVDKTTKAITTKQIRFDQRLCDGGIIRSEKVPTVIAWYDQQLLIGKGGADLKYRLKKGVNIWYSFKMELGEDLGSKYYDSELGRNSEFPILNPKDAAKIFFQFLKAQIDRYVRAENLPKNIQYAVSIPASFEANQRRELIYVLEQNGISIDRQFLIDEPNAAFLSYVQVSSLNNEPLVVPDGDNPKVLVFDFGAGTCDISILELGKDLNGIYSRNLAISKFEALGGDDIDRLIAIEHLFPQLLKESGRSATDFRTPEKQRIICRLLKAAEELKISICENVALQTSIGILPAAASSDGHVSVGSRIEIDSRKGLLTLTKPRLSYAGFNDVMKIFLKSESLVPYSIRDSEDEFATIFNPVETTLKKASLSKDEVDYVLLIGGSSKNPYVQAALKEYFSGSDILVPSDLQAHVSSGAAIHSLVYNGSGKNIIQPITSEPLLVITKDETPKVILRAGTQIPCDRIVIDDLVTVQDGQKAIELPICIGNADKLLYNIQIVSRKPGGFRRNTRVKLELEITADKLLLARASAEGQRVVTEPMNPFANRELNTEQRIVLKAERQANIDAEQNGGRPTKQGLALLYKAYDRVGNYLRAAETLEHLNELYPSIYNLNEIGVFYSRSGHYHKALEYYEKAYHSNKNATTAFNYACMLKHKNKVKFRELLEESLRLAPEYPHCLFELGRVLKRDNDPEGIEMVQKAFDIWNRQYETDQLSKNNYSWFSSAADELGMGEFAQHIRESEPKISREKLYDPANLTVTSTDEVPVKRRFWSNWLQ